MTVVLLIIAGLIVAYLCWAIPTFVRLTLHPDHDEDDDA